jgi:PiT family inorganic phosphate transporter
VRALLILTCTGVSFAHGSNDGQKGMGLIMLILIGIVPTAFALDSGLNAKDYQAIVTQTPTTSAFFHQLAGTDPVSQDQAADVINGYLKTRGELTIKTYAAMAEKTDGKKSLADVPKDHRSQLRSDIYLVSASIGKLLKAKEVRDADAAKSLGTYKKSLDKATNFIPVWVKVAVAIALGLGTMIGWKRIVVTVGERIGKAHLTYGQGASAEIVAYGTIQAADIFGLPVSTTHILSSGVAGTMFANRSGLQANTLRNIVLAWVLTLPVCVLLGSLLFAFGLRIVAAFGLH